MYFPEDNVQQVWAPISRRHKQRNDLSGIMFLSLHIRYKCLFPAIILWESWPHYCSFFLFFFFVFHISFVLSAFSFSFTVITHPCVETNQEHIEQAGRVHRIIIPCIHLCTFAVVAEQFVGRTRCHQATTTITITIQQRFQSSLNAGKQFAVCVARSVR